MLIITKIQVVGPGNPDQHYKNDRIWTEARIDDGNVRDDLTITVRTFLHGGHPLAVYINGAEPLYPTVVYGDNDQLLGVFVGIIGDKELRGTK